MKTETIRQSATFPTTPHDVYEALMDSKKHSKFTGCVAKISRRVGGSFMAMESLRGSNVELVPDQKIVQTWQCDIEGWPKSHFSTLTIRLKPTKAGARLDFEQADVPAACAKKIAAAWTKNYWQPLKAMFKESPFAAL
jgi:activator of HSP90 ATPase